MRAIKHIGLLLGCILLLVGCHVKPAPPRANGMVEFDFHCHYLLDEKYKLDQEEGKSAAWITDLLEGHLKGEPGEHYDLLSHRGGGPLGAEWNSNGDLYFWGRIEQPAAYFKNLKLFLNQKDYLSDFRIESKPLLTVFGLRIAAAQWQSNLKEIEKGSYPYLFRKDDLSRLDLQNNGLESLKGLTMQFQFEYAGLSPNSILKGFAWGGGE